MLLANLSGQTLAARSVYRLPSPRLETRGFDFAIFHDSQAIKISPQTCKLIRYQDLIPGLRPDLVGSRTCVESHFRAIRRCRKDSIYVCSSEPTRGDLLRAFPELEQRCVVIPDVLVDSYYPDHQPPMLSTILKSRQSAASGRARVQKSADRGQLAPYLIFVSTIEPRKNHLTLIRAFEKLLARHATDLRLVIVGSAGWKYQEALQAMQPLITQRRLYHLENVPQQELRILYTHAEALVFPSFYEGFGYPPLEAMCCDTPTVVSDVATHRWVYGDAALYFDPYRTDSLVASLAQLLFSSDDSLRDALVCRAASAWRGISRKRQVRGGRRSLRSFADKASPAMRQTPDWQA